MSTLTISELANKLGLNKQTLRKWEKDFDLKIPRNEMGHRYYTEKEFEVFNNIQNMKNEGANIKVIQKILDRSETVSDQKEQALELITIDKLTGNELNELIKNHLSGMISEHEIKIKEEYEKKIDELQENLESNLTNELEKQEIKIREQISSENAKLVEYMKKRDEENQKKSWWRRIFGK
ncbi:MerR family transcriptional regulator [Senegalia sp. (in: firmicutes)]|uniref:MerR family transcriptional regulator n=1 Tax=Senegalia sp. (in: firmicutes) TaxID=1924098 RepID=UPI003F989119